MLKKFIINKSNSSNAYDERIKFLILHYTQRDFATSLDLLTKDVSCHYLIADDPVEILQLVAEDKRAWHCGKSFWQGRANINDSSIGIEIVNLDGNKYSYDDKQIDLVMDLCKDIISRYGILPQNILGHSDIAPLRKTDPGILFPWQKLYKNGIGIMVDRIEVENLAKKISMPTALELQQKLSIYGYEINLTGEFDNETIKVLDAFRRHFCPDFIGRKIDLISYATLLKLIDYL